MKETESLISTLQSVRNITKFYFSKLPQEAIHFEPEINGVKLNSAYWIAAHLVWSEHFLLIQGVLNKKMQIPWVDKFALGVKPPKENGLPEFSEVMETLDRIFGEALNGISELNEDELDKKNHINATFGGVNSIRTIINHTIRHEPMHVGQLSWILKINGIDLV